MADNAFVKIGTALLKHQVKKLVGEEALGAIGEELADIGGDKLDVWLGDNSTIVEIEKAAITARDTFRGKVNNDEVEQWMVMLPIHDLPAVLSAIEELPKSPDETKLENALRESIALNWNRLSTVQVDNAVNAFLFALRSALLPIEKQTLMVMGRSVLRTEDKVNQLLKLVENLQAIRPDTAHLKPETPKWFFGHRYGDLDSFTGRVTELKMLDEWLGNKDESLFIINAFGGFGKSTLTWYWFKNMVDEEKWPTAVWWSFYEKESGFDSFLTETLSHLDVETKERSARQQVNDLLNAMQQTNILIVLDGFERLLRQYSRLDAALQDDEDVEIDPSQRDCTSQSAEIFLHGLSDKKMISKVLMTSRLFPLALEGRNGKLQRGCREVNLKGFSPDDAVKYFQKEEIKATRAEIIEICSKYDYHPLSLSLLVGLINEDHEYRGDIEAVKNLEIFDDVKARRHHVLERAYESLPPERRDLLTKISCFRGSMEYAVLKKVFPSPDLDKALLDLRKRGLLQYSSDTQGYDMHPIVRRYTYKHLTPADSTAAHTRLRDYFEVALKSPRDKNVDFLTLAIEFYYHTIRIGEFENAFSYCKYFLYENTHSYLTIELLEALIVDKKTMLPKLRDKFDQGWVLSALGNVYFSNGNPQGSIMLYEKANEIYKNGNSTIFYNIANAQLSIGALVKAKTNILRSISISEQNYQFPDWLGSELAVASERKLLGYVFIIRGLWADAENELNSAFDVFTKENDTQGQGAVWIYRALRALLMAREINNLKLKLEYYKVVIESAERAFEFDKKRNFIRAHWLLGAACGANGDLDKAEENLFKALSLCRQINEVEAEADILLDVARLRYDQGDFKDAQEKASEALMITERSGYVLQGADVNLFLAQYALEQEKDKAKAKEYAESALKLAYCDGPPYYYKVAYEEAERMLKMMNEE